MENKRRIGSQYQSHFVKGTRWFLEEYYKTDNVLEEFLNTDDSRSVYLSLINAKKENSFYLAEIELLNKKGR
jgi:hypothetical protein